jgi:hypothetical protein
MTANRHEKICTPFASSCTQLRYLAYDVLLIFSDSTQADELARGLPSEGPKVHETRDSPHNEHVEQDVPGTRASDTIMVRMLSFSPSRPDVLHVCRLMS